MTYHPPCLCCFLFSPQFIILFIHLLSPVHTFKSQTLSKYSPDSHNFSPCHPDSGIKCLSVIFPLSFFLFLFFPLSPAPCSPLSQSSRCSIALFHVSGVKIGWHVVSCGLKWMSITFFFILSPPGDAPWRLYVPAGIFHFYSLSSSAISSITLFVHCTLHANCIP